MYDGHAQAVCEMLAIAGKQLDEVARDRKRVDGYFSILDKYVPVHACLQASQ